MEIKENCAVELFQIFEVEEILKEILKVVQVEMKVLKVNEV